jgi:hypothetical protein
VLAFLWSVVARLIQRSRAGLERRRIFGGASSTTDVAVTVAALPWRLVRSVAMAMVTMILPMLVGISTAFIARSLLMEPVIAESGLPGQPYFVALFVGALAALVTAWWGPGGWSLRTGSRAIVRVVTTGRTGRIVVVVLSLLVVLAAMMVSSNEAYAPDWAPFPPPGAIGGRVA